MTTELFNDFVFGALTHWLVIYTDFCYDLKVKYNSGYVYILIVLFVIVINLGHILLQIVFPMIRFFKLRFLRCVKRFKNKYFPPPQLKEDNAE